MEGCRPATEDDLPRLAELARLAIDEQFPMKGGDVFADREARCEPLDESLKRDLVDPACRVLCGTIDGAVIGYAVARIEPLRDGGCLGVLADIFVEPEAREVGVGEALVNDIVDWCRDAGCIGVDSFALPGNRQTKNFFETFGFTARMLVVHHRFRERPEEAPEAGGPGEGGGPAGGGPAGGPGDEVADGGPGGGGTGGGPGDGGGAGAA